MTAGLVTTTALLIAWSQVHTIRQLYVVMVRIGACGAMFAQRPRLRRHRVPLHLRIRRLGVRIPSGAQDRKALDLQEQGSSAFALSSLVDGWVLRGCSCDAHPLRPAPSRQ